MGLIRRLCVEEAVGTELTEKLTENLRETLCDNKVSVISVRSFDARPAYDESDHPLTEAQRGSEPEHTEVC